MKLYRIASSKRSRDMSGKGAELFGGRWNSPGRPLLYTSQNISLAMLEVLVNTSPEALRQPFAVACLNLHDTCTIEKLTLENLPAGWDHYPHSAGSQKLGNKWLLEQRSMVLQVPSAVNPLEHNFLINPALAKGRLDVVKVKKLYFDARFHQEMEPL